VRQWLAEQRASVEQPPAEGTGPASAPTGQAAAHRPKPLRERMPIAAAFFAELRQAWGQEQTDRWLRKAVAGHPVGYFAEIGADGALHEFGRTREGHGARVVAMADGGRSVVMVDRQGREVPAVADLPFVPAVLFVGKSKGVKQ
jgi:hypothetical protein